MSGLQKIKEHVSCLQPTSHTGNAGERRACLVRCSGAHCELSDRSTVPWPEG